MSDNKPNMEIEQCSFCASLYIPPKYLCPECGSEDFKKYQIEGKGKIISFTKIFVSTEKFKEDLPYYLAVIDLNEGIKVTARIKENENTNLAIGGDVYFLKQDYTGYWFEDG